MTKATKTKKVKEEVHTVEVTHSGVTEILPISEEGIISVEETIPDIVVEDGLEFKQTEELLVPVIEETIRQISEAKLASNDELTIEQKIINFVDSRTGEIKLNDFLKSLYGVPKNGEPALWLSQGASKTLRAVLEKLSNEGYLTITANAHMKLGTFYYPDSVTGKTEYHNLNTVIIVAKK